jgi:hypothetical protein
MLMRVMEALKNSAHRGKESRFSSSEVTQVGYLRRLWDSESRPQKKQKKYIGGDYKYIDRNEEGDSNFQMHFKLHL